MTSLEAMGFSKLGPRVLTQIEELKKVVIAVVNGFALGGGMEIALSCDFIYASEKAKLGLPEVTLGVFPGWGGTQRLPRLIGKARAKELILTGAIVSAQEAKDLGIVNRVFPAETLLEETRAIARKIAENGPIALQLAKNLIDRGCDVGLKDGCLLEATTFGTLFATKDQREGMTAFMEKRKPQFRGE
jgi:enoyl-CoA hydratase